MTGVGFRRFRPPAATAAGLALSLLLAVGVSAAVAPNWRYAEGSLHDGETATQFRVWWRDGAAVTQILNQGAMDAEFRCDSGTYTHDEFEGQWTVIRSGLRETDCMRWATGLFGPIVPEADGLQREGTVQLGDRQVDVYVGLAEEGVRRLIVDPDNGLPLAAEFPGDRRLTWEYERVALASVGPPDRAAPDTWSTESYAPLTIEELRIRVDLGIPADFGSFKFGTAFVYTSARSGESESASWADADGREVQLSHGRGMLDPADLGVQPFDTGVIFRAQVVTRTSRSSRPIGPPSMPFWRRSSSLLPDAGIRFSRDRSVVY